MGAWKCHFFIYICIQIRPELPSSGASVVKTIRDSFVESQEETLMEKLQGMYIAEERSWPPFIWEISSLSAPLDFHQSPPRHPTSPLYWKLFWGKLSFISGSNMSYKVREAGSSWTRWIILRAPTL